MTESNSGGIGAGGGNSIGAGNGSGNGGIGNGNGESSKRFILWFLVPISLFVGAFAAIAVLRDVSVAYDYYMHEYLSGSIFSNFSAFVPAPFLFAACFVALVFAIRNAKGATTAPAWRKFDFPLLCIIAACIVSVCFIVAVKPTMNWTYNNWIYNSNLLVLSLVCYLAGMIVVIEGIARLRDGQLFETCYLLRFLKVYPPTKIIGLLMTLLFLAGLSILVLLVSFPPHFDSPRVIVMITSALLILGGLTYLCNFVLTLSTTYEKVNAEKIRAERFRSELITNVSHDIRTPLTAIISYVGLLKTLPVENTDYTNYVEILDKKSARLKTLITDLMEASKASTGNVTTNLQELDLAEILGQIAGEFDDLFSEKDLCLILRLPEQTPLSEQAQAPFSAQPKQIPLVLADNRHLWRVLENLFGNVAKYALPGTRVFVEVSSTKSSTVFSMKNTSRNPIDLHGDELVEQFIRGDRARQGEGSGLGLYISKSLVELMNGEFKVHISGDLFEARIRLPSL